MYSGHFGLALAGAGAARRVPLALLITAAFASDIIEGIVAAFNVADPTRVYSHSLPVSAAAGLVIGLAWLLRGGRWWESGVLLLVAASHTALDFVTAKKAWWPGEPVAGWNLYSRPWLDSAVEAALCTLGWALYLTVLPPARRKSWLAVAPLLLLLVAQFAAVAYHEWFEPVSEAGLSKFVR